MAPVPPLDSPAIGFTLLDGEKRPVQLSDYRGKNVVIAFYPADWSPVCTSELALIQETLDDIRAMNADVIGISVDNTWSHKAWAQKQNLTYPLLSDFWPHGAVAQQYGVFRQDKGTTDRALFFVDTEGILRTAWVAEDPAIAPGINIIFEALEKMQGVRHAR